MNTQTRLLHATSICAMSIEDSNQLDAYYKSLADRAEQVDAGLITIYEAIELIRSA